jgi:hypothetical protein
MKALSGVFVFVGTVEVVFLLSDCEAVTLVGLLSMQTQPSDPCLLPHSQRKQRTVFLIGFTGTALYQTTIPNLPI